MCVRARACVCVGVCVCECGLFLFLSEMCTNSEACDAVGLHRRGIRFDDNGRDGCSEAL